MYKTSSGIISVSRGLLIGLCCFTACGLTLGLRPGLAADNVARATQLYERCQYKEARQSLEAELKANPRDASAHYLLGNVLVTEKSFAEAIKEYEYASMLDPNSPCGRYSKQEIARLQAQGKHEVVAPAAAVKTAITADEKESEDPEVSQLKHSVQTTSRQTSAASQAAQEECEHRLKEIRRESAEKIAALREEMRSQISANSIGPRRGYVDNSAMTGPISDDFNARIKTEQDYANRRCEEVTTMYRQRQESIEQAGTNVDKAFLDGGRTTGVKLSPLGTNLHVRNYETSDEASGETVPLLAEPGKLRVDSKSSSKADNKNNSGPDSKTDSQGNSQKKRAAN